MSKKGYFLIIIIVAGILIVAGIISLQPRRRNNNTPPPEFRPQGELVMVFNISGVGEREFEVNKTWATIEIQIIYDPSTISSKSYVKLYDSNGNLQQEFNIRYEDVSPGTKFKKSVEINLYAPPLIEGPYGEWKISYKLPEDAYVHVEIYETPLNAAK